MSDATAPADLGEITRCYSMRFVRRLGHPPARVWRALTDPGEVGRWMARRAHIDLRVGGAYHVTFRSDEEGDLNGVLVRVEPERRLALVWGLSVLEWTLEPEGPAGCRLTFLHHGQPPGLVEDEAGLAVGWHLWLDDLAGHVDGRRPVPASEEPLLGAYRARIDAALGR